MANKHSSQKIPSRKVSLIEQRTKWILVFSFFTLLLLILIAGLLSDSDFIRKRLSGSATSTLSTSPGTTAASTGTTSTGATTSGSTTSSSTTTSSGTTTTSGSGSTSTTTGTGTTTSGTTTTPCLTSEYMTCPDGQKVYKVASTCTFPACPTSSTPTTCSTSEYITCPNGQKVYRVAATCTFPTCPTTGGTGTTTPTTCATDYITCPNGLKIYRTASTCTFPACPGTVVPVTPTKTTVPLFPTTPICGNGLLESGELCESTSTLLRLGVSCKTSDGRDGKATCDNCKLGACTPITYCGDGIKNGDEQCDDGLQNGVSCLAAPGKTCDWCTTKCEIRHETGQQQITECSDELDNDGDGLTDWNGGLEGAEMSDPDCSSALDTSEATEIPLNLNLNLCGNGLIDANELCDIDANGETVFSQLLDKKQDMCHAFQEKFTSGILGCNPETCQPDTSSCGVGKCNDGVQNSPYECEWKLYNDKKGEICNKDTCEFRNPDDLYDQQQNLVPPTECFNYQVGDVLDPQEGTFVTVVVKACDSIGFEARESGNNIGKHQVTINEISNRKVKATVRSDPTDIELETGAYEIFDFGNGKIFVGADEVNDETTSITIAALSDDSAEQLTAQQQQLGEAAPENSPTSSSGSSTDTFKSFLENNGNPTSFAKQSSPLPAVLMGIIGVLAVLVIFVFTRLAGTLKNQEYAQYQQ